MPVPGCYVGRFAPSPTGPLHAGSLVAALASWLDARAQQGRWLVRIEDVDTPRCRPGMAEIILDQLARCGLLPDLPPLWQSSHGDAYQAALNRLDAGGWAYGCACTRREIDLALNESGSAVGGGAERVYPGTCRDGIAHGRSARATRVRCERAETHLARPEAPAGSSEIRWTDRRLGEQHQNLAREVGDFVVHRADGLWAYQLAVVVDDAAQGVTDIVRGEDLADNTARQIHLQNLLGLATPRYLHLPLVLGADSRKLSKQNGAKALELNEPLIELRAAAEVLGLPFIARPRVEDWLADAVAAWARRHVHPI
jgi:glutamyl-Q tRNA(Asp) synthetase